MAHFLRRAIPSALRRPFLGNGSVSSRHLNLHEYQAKQLMSNRGVSVQAGSVAETADSARTIAESLTGDMFVVKAQVHAGGRGKGVFTNGFKGGVHLCKSPAEVEEVAGKMLGQTLVTVQTGDAGAKVDKVLVLEALDSFKAEFYLAIILDRAHGGPVIVASPQGGVDIEGVAEEDPSAIHTFPVDITKGITDEIANGVGATLGGGDAELEGKIAKQVHALYDLFVSCDATQVEINPLAVTGGNDPFCVDAKINIDESAAARLPNDLSAMREDAILEEDPREIEAGKHGLNYIPLDGSIGCLVNGAGLAMATMDVVKLHGGDPANFCDLGGGATEESVSAAFKLITEDPSVKAVLVNIFGGIVKCDLIAKGIVAAAANLNLAVPLVVRLEGTNVETGKRILAESGLDIVTAEDLDDAASKAVASLA